MTSSPSTRLLHLYFPHLPLDRWARREDVRLWGPFAVSERRGNSDQILCANPHALHAGVRPGLSVTDAHAICPDLLTEGSDPVRDARLLSALRVWADRFSPRVALDPPDGLVLDVSGCAHLFGGEVRFATLVRQEVEDLHVKARVAIANTRRAARGFARFGGEATLVTDAQREHVSVARLPIAALDLDASVQTDLRRIGVETIGDLSQFKSSELARRFSMRVPAALDEIFGHRFDPVVPSARPPAFAARMTLPEEIAHVEAVMNMLERLSDRVCQRLTERGYAARGFALSLSCVDGATHELSISFAVPTRTVEPILRQFRRPVEALRMDFGAERFRLVALHAETFQERQIQAGDATEAGRDAVARALTTLGNRLGFDRIVRPVAGADNAPERETAFALLVGERTQTPTDPRAYPRPEIVITPYRLHVTSKGRPPRAFSYQGEDFKTCMSEGPERIAPFVWDEPRHPFEARLRDYWRVRVSGASNGPRLFWLMHFPHHPEEGWYLCGEFLHAPRVALVLSETA
ncbi:MAG: DNA polymerase Y family protein [Litorimonas sp.]